MMGNNASCRVFRMGNISVKMFDGVIRTLCDVRHVPELGKFLFHWELYTVMDLITNLPME